MSDHKHTDIGRVKKLLSVTDADLADMFGYVNRDAYYNSTARARVERGIVSMYNRITDRIFKILQISTMPNSEFYEQAIKEITLGVPESESKLDLLDPLNRNSYDSLKTQIANALKEGRTIEMVQED